MGGRGQSQNFSSLERYILPFVIKKKYLSTMPYLFKLPAFLACNPGVFAIQIRENISFDVSVELVFCGGR
jgi:hypothetical protein